MTSAALSQRERSALKALRRPGTDPIRIEGNTIVDGIAAALPYVRGRLLDIGCGTMPYADLVRDRVERHIGVDLRPDPVRPPHVVGDSLALPFKGDSFDSVLCTQVLEHVRDPFQLLHEVARVLRAGGYGIFTMPATWPLHEEPYDYFRYTRYGLQELARRSGLDVAMLAERGGAIAALGQLLSAVGYDAWGKNAITRIPLKLVSTPLLFLAEALDRLFFYRGFSLGYVLVVRKPAAEGSRLHPVLRPGHAR